LWGLFKKKMWLFYFGLILFALSRPSFLIVIAAILCTDIYFLIINKDFKLFIKELGVKLIPILTGVLITFFIQYLESGSFFRMFEVHHVYWHHFFQYPKTITDWSTEGYGMNIFSVICVVVPLGLYMFSFLLKHFEARKVPPVSLFSAETVKQYLFGLSVVYFVGNFLFVFFFQGGNLNGLHRYILVSPFFYVLLFILAPKVRSMKLIYELAILIPIVFIGYLFLIHGPYQHKITFLDAGYFLLVVTTVYFLLFDRIKLPVKISLLILIVLCNTVWLTYLYNHFLNNAFIIA
jgi:hypothetical protein